MTGFSIISRVALFFSLLVGALTPALGAVPRHAAAKPRAAVAKPAPVRVDTAPIVRVALETALGTIIVDLDRAHAPVTADNFLRYVDQKRFESNAPETERSQESAIEAVGLIIQHHVERRTVTLFAVVSQAVQIELDGKRRIELVKFLAQVFWEIRFEFRDERCCFHIERKRNANSFSCDGLTGLRRIISASSRRVSA